MKLTKAEIKRRDELSVKLAEQWEALEAAIVSFNEETQERWNNGLSDEINKYNSILEEAREWSSEIAQRLTDEISDKSETWQESERGQAAQVMYEEYESVDLGNVQIDSPGEIEFDIEAHSDILDQLPESDG